MLNFHFILFVSRNTNNNTNQFCSLHSYRRDFQRIMLIIYRPLIMLVTFELKQSTKRKNILPLLGQLERTAYGGMVGVHRDIAAALRDYSSPATTKDSNKVIAARRKRRSKSSSSDFNIIKSGKNISQRIGRSCHLHLKRHCIV